MSVEPTPVKERTAVEDTLAQPRRGLDRRPRRRPRNRPSTWRPWLLLAPALVVLGGLLLYPLYRVTALSFQEFGLRQLVQGETVWIGLDNYRELATDPLLWRTVLPNTVVFAAVNVVLTVVVGTLVALLLTRLRRLSRAIVTSAIMVAWAVPAVTGTYVWVFLFDPRSGAIMRALGALGLVDPETTNWFTERLTFYPRDLASMTIHV